MEKPSYYTATWLTGDKALCQLRSNSETEINELAWRLRGITWFADDLAPDRIHISRITNGDSDLIDVLPITG